MSAAHSNHPQAQLATSGHNPLATHPARPTRRQFLRQRIQQIARAAMGDGLPRVLSPEEITRMRHETLSHIDRIHLLEDAKIGAGPNVDTLTIDDALVLARCTYHYFFTRIFRVNELPPEIVTNIFRYIVWPVPNPDTGILWRLWITWTCRRWRAIAIADFTLWNAVWFRDRAPFNRSWAFLERAGSSPLDLRISSEDETPISLEDMDGILTRLLPNFYRIRILIFIGSTWDHVALLLGKLQSVGLANSPITMERLEIHRMGHIDYNTIGLPKPITLFSGEPAPRLHYLSLNGVHIDWDSPIMHNLTTIDVRKLPLELSPTITRFREILINCPALRKLCLDGAGPQFDLYDPPPLPIVMTNLKILCISDYSAQYARHVLSQFTAPHLVDLTFINLTGEDYSPLYEILVNRYPEIKLLTMYAVDSVVRSKAMVQWLASLPQLKYLRVANLPESFFKLFLIDPRKVMSTSEDHSPPKAILAPKLAIIESHPSVIGQLVGFAAERLAMGAPLERVYITRTNESSINQHFREACAALMKLTSVYFMSNGTRTPEEDAILAE